MRKRERKASKSGFYTRSWVMVALGVGAARESPSSTTCFCFPGVLSVADDAIQVRRKGGSIDGTPDCSNYWIKRSYREAGVGEVDRVRTCTAH